MKTPISDLPRANPPGGAGRPSVWGPRRPQEQAEAPEDAPQATPEANLSDPSTPNWHPKLAATVTKQILWKPGCTAGSSASATAYWGSAYSGEADHPLFSEAAAWGHLRSYLDSLLADPNPEQVLLMTMLIGFWEVKDKVVAQNLADYCSSRLTHAQDNPLGWVVVSAYEVHFLTLQISPPEGEDFSVLGLPPQVQAIVRSFQSAVLMAALNACTWLIHTTGRSIPNLFLTGDREEPPCIESRLVLEWFTGPPSDPATRVARLTLTLLDLREAADWAPAEVQKALFQEAALNASRAVDCRWFQWEARLKFFSTDPALQAGADLAGEEAQRVASRQDPTFALAMEAHFLFHWKAKGFTEAALRAGDLKEGASYLQQILMSDWDERHWWGPMMGQVFLPEGELSERRLVPVRAIQWHCKGALRDREILLEGLYEEEEEE